MLMTQEVFTREFQGLGLGSRAAQGVGVGEVRRKRQGWALTVQGAEVQQAQMTPALQPSPGPTQDSPAAAAQTAQAPPHPCNGNHQFCLKPALWHEAMFSVRPFAWAKLEDPKGCPGTPARADIQSTRHLTTAFAELSAHLKPLLGAGAERAAGVTAPIRAGAPGRNTGAPSPCLSSSWNSLLGKNRLEAQRAR